MRFAANGPSISDELLLARDEGRVIFFCGAGVSRARAKLPDFFGLAKIVIQKLGVPNDSSAFQLLNVAQNLDQRVGVRGIVSADRIFGLLEREFPVRDIEEAVSEAIKPKPKCDISAHRILLDLATTPTGKIQLVTTNFDLLFEKCLPNIKKWCAPRLPDPSISGEIDGIVYLHGRVNRSYSGTSDGSFVLSSSEFGRAYLSDGWATSFIKEILFRYVIVFVGYTADDPPVQYLLEAIQKSNVPIAGAYAFQSGEHEEALGIWRHKGVEAIAYDASNDHAGLWQTLEAWAVRARSPEKWYSGVVERAKKRPSELEPHERGQVVHVVSTHEGAKQFSSSADPPPAEWLCVFDPYRRFARSSKTYKNGEGEPLVDPFDFYGIDSDIAPQKMVDEVRSEDRRIPPGTLDVLAPNRKDRTDIEHYNLAAMRGPFAKALPILPKRVDQLCEWLASVSNQPAAVWWAAYQVGLHPRLVELISRRLSLADYIVPPHIRRGWRYIFQSRIPGQADNSFLEEHFLATHIKSCGWTALSALQYARLEKPYLKVEPSLRHSPLAPISPEASELNDLLRADVEYGDRDSHIEAPDEWLGVICRHMRRNLELAVELENELGGFGLDYFSPIVNEVDPTVDGYARKHGLSKLVLSFTSLFERLCRLKKSSALLEMRAWPLNDDTVFSRLRMWACGLPKFLSTDDVVDQLVSLSDEALWNQRHQRDLMLSLASRWPDLNRKTKKLIEKRFLDGPPRWKDETETTYAERAAWSTLNRLHWLANNGCVLEVNLPSVDKRLRKRAPDWKPEYADKASESLESRTGWVKTETDYDRLTHVPLKDVLQTALDIAQADREFLSRKDPFSGLAADKPVRALAALCRAQSDESAIAAGWRTFLMPSSRKSDSIRLQNIVGCRLLRLPNSLFDNITSPIAEWLESVSAQLSTQNQIVFDQLIDRVTDRLCRGDTHKQSSIVRQGTDVEWATEALNSAAGKIAEAHLKDNRTKSFKRGQPVDAVWKGRQERLLALPGDMRRYVLVLLCFQINWLHHIDEEWTTKTLVETLLKGNAQDKDAGWAGVLWANRVPNIGLYDMLKPEMINILCNGGGQKDEHERVLTAFVLAGWGSRRSDGERVLTDEELRHVVLNSSDDAKSHMLWQISSWSREKPGKGMPRWKALLPEFLKVWPRQLAAKSPRVSARLCELAFENEDRFPEISKLVMPLVTKMGQEHFALPSLSRGGQSIAKRFPKEVLALLHATLPERAAAWPYDVGPLVMSLGNETPT